MVYGQGRAQPTPRRNPLPALVGLVGVRVAGAVLHIYEAVGVGDLLAGEQLKNGADLVQFPQCRNLMSWWQRRLQTGNEACRRTHANAQEEKIRRHANCSPHLSCCAKTL